MRGPVDRPASLEDHVGPTMTTSPAHDPYSPPARAARWRDLLVRGAAGLEGSTYLTADQSSAHARPTTQIWQAEQSLSPQSTRLS